MMKTMDKIKTFNRLVVATLLLCGLFTNAMAQSSRRYAEPVFDEVNVEADIPVSSGIKEFGSNLVEYLSFVGNSLWENNVKGRNTVCCYHDHQVVIDVVHVAYLTMIYALLSFKAEVSLC